jgi:hypothetical protein
MTGARPFTLPVASFAAASLAVYVVALLIVGSQAFGRWPDDLALGVTLDLTIVVPLLYYLLVVRGARAPVFTILPVLILSAFGAWRVLPENHHAYLYAVEILLVTAELLIVGWCVARVYGEVRHQRSRPTAAIPGEDAVDRLRSTLYRISPAAERPLAGLLAHELAVFYYAFLFWRVEPQAQAEGIAFTYHHRNGSVGLLGALLGIIAIETAVVHLLVSRWSMTAAWVLTAVGVYGIIWLLGFLQSVRLRPLLVTRDALHMRIGLLWSARIPLRRIAAIMPIQGSAEGRKASGYLHAAVLAEPQLLIELAEPIEVHGPFGYTKRDVRRIGLGVDDPARLEAELKTRSDFLRA